MKGFRVRNSYENFPPAKSNPKNGKSISKSGSRTSAHPEAQFNPKTSLDRNSGARSGRDLNQNQSSPNLRASQHRKWVALVSTSPRCAEDKTPPLKRKLTQKVLQGVSNDYLPMPTFEKNQNLNLDTLLDTSGHQDTSLGSKSVNLCSNTGNITALSQNMTLQKKFPEIKEEDED
jgi:hypothetical protein